jgi:hypothetical protein
MNKDQIRCHESCPRPRQICRREFLTMVAAGLLAACSSGQQATPTPTDAPPTTMPTAAPTKEETMAAYIAYCGYDACPECPHYGRTCDGCLTKDGLLRQGVVNCAVRNCNVKQEIANCAYCEEYACDKLTDMFASWRQGTYAQAADQAQATLDEIHQSLSQ